MKKSIAQMTLLGSLVLCGTNVYAQSSGSHGGGTILKDGRTQIADPYVTEAYPTHPMVLSEELKISLKKIQRLMTARQLEVAKLFTNLETASYLYVDHLPCNDMENLKSLDGSEIKNFACTQDQITYVLKPVFDAMSIRDQALGLIHERIHAVYPGHPHILIVDVIKGTWLALAIQDEQKSGILRDLTEKEVADLNQAQISAHALGLTDQYYSVSLVTHYRGGGMIQKYPNPNSSSIFISIDSQLSSQSPNLHHLTLQNYSVVILTRQYENWHCEDQEISDVVANHTEIHGCVSLNHATFTDSEVENSRVMNSIVNASNLKKSSLIDANFQKCIGTFNAQGAHCDSVTVYKTTHIEDMPTDSIDLPEGSEINSSEVWCEGRGIKLTLAPHLKLSGLKLIANDNGGFFRFKNSVLSIRFTAQGEMNFNKNQTYEIIKKKGVRGWAQESGFLFDTVDSLSPFVMRK